MPALMAKKVVAEPKLGSLSKSEMTSDFLQPFRTLEDPFLMRTPLRIAAHTCPPCLRPRTRSLFIFPGEPLPPAHLDHRPSHRRSPCPPPPHRTRPPSANYNRRAHQRPHPATGTVHPYVLYRLAHRRQLATTVELTAAPGHPFRAEEDEQGP